METQVNIPNGIIINDKLHILINDPIHSCELCSLFKECDNVEYCIVKLYKSANYLNYIFKEAKIIINIK